MCEEEATSEVKRIFDSLCELVMNAMDLDPVIDGTLEKKVRLNSRRSKYIDREVLETSVLNVACYVDFFLFDHTISLDRLISFLSSMQNARQIRAAVSN